MPSPAKLALATAACCLLAPGTTYAQQHHNSYSPYAPHRTYHSSYRTPGVSPYLNLLRDDAELAVNYYALVRPQVMQEEYNARGKYNVARMRNQLSSDERRLEGRGGSGRARPTGQRGRFMDYSSFYFREPGQP